MTGPPQEHPVLDGDGGELTRPDTEEGRELLADGLVGDDHPVPLGLPELAARGKEHLLGGVRPHGVAEGGIVVAPA